MSPVSFVLLFLAFSVSEVSFGYQEKGLYQLMFERVHFTVP